MRLARAAAVSGLLAAGLVTQVHFFRAYPQPILFGDPAGYYEVGQRFGDALARWRAGEEPAAVFDSVRGLLYLAGVGSLFAVLDALRPGDLAFFRLVMAAFNTLAMLGCFVLARRLSGSFAGGILALGVAAVYPSFSVQTGRLYPDPLTGCLLVWAAVLFLEGQHRGRAAWTAGAGFVFGLALLVRSQIMDYMLIVLGLCLVATAPRWLRRREPRRHAMALVAGCLPLALAWALIVRAVGGRDDVVQLGNATFKPLYLYGFWQFLDTDGWIGPYRFKTEPYYRALEAEARSDPDLLRSRARQVPFVARYVAERPWVSLLLVLDNAYRLYDRPANDYKWDYPFSYPAQVALQRAIVVLALAGLVLLVADRAAYGAVYVVPLALAALHGMVFAWPRYNLPAMPLVIAAAGAGLARLARGLRRPAALSGPAGRAAAGILALGLLLLLAARLGRERIPEPAAVARGLGVVLVLSSPFVLAAAMTGGSARRRWALAGAAWACLAAPVTAHALRDRLWHQFETAIGGDVPGVEQEIVLGPEAVASLAAAREAFLVFDLRVPRGDPSGIELEVSGRSVPGSRLVPTMPRLRESTSTGGRDWRGYPQWWALPLDPGLLPQASGAFHVRLTHRGADPLLLGADRFSGQDRWYEGPSFGDWPRLAALKLEYDGDYRLPVRLPLGSGATRSRLVRADGERVALAGVHRIRLVTLGQNEGRLPFESAPLPRASRVALGFAAYSGERDEAQLLVEGRPVLTFPLGRREDFDVESPPYRLCHRAGGLRGDKPYGAYYLLGPATAPGRSLGLEVRFKTGMSAAPMFFVVDRKSDPGELKAGLGRCGLSEPIPFVRGAVRILDGSRNNYPEDTGRWTVTGVF